MEEQGSKSSELVTWYLARLRNSARQNSLQRKLTPMTLVATDKNLIQEIVMQSQVGYEQRSAGILKILQNKNRGVRTAQTVLLITGAAATVFLLYLCISS